MPSPLAANINDGVLIDMSMFNGVKYDAANSLATVGAGQKWESVYDQLDPYNVTVVGGRVLDVGVGGLTLGSESPSDSFYLAGILLISKVGYRISLIFTAWFVTTWSTSRFRFHITNGLELLLMQHQVVLANSSVVNANATSNLDLWWALKGGSNNFGKSIVVLMSHFDTYNIPRYRHSVHPFDLSHPRGLGWDQKLHAQRTTCPLLRHD